MRKISVAVLSALVAAAPAAADAPVMINFSPICEHGRLVGLQGYTERGIRGRITIAIPEGLCDLVRLAPRAHT